MLELRALCKSLSFTYGCHFTYRIFYERQYGRALYCTVFHGFNMGIEAIIKSELLFLTVGRAFSHIMVELKL